MSPFRRIRKKLQSKAIATHEHSQDFCKQLKTANLVRAVTLKSTLTHKYCSNFSKRGQ